MEIIKYDFFKDYLGNQEFKTIFYKRFDRIKKNYIKFNGNDITDFEIIKENFVEIFSWSVFNKTFLLELINTIKDSNLTTILDPCAGNAFHSFLFKTFSNLETITIDIQDEEDSWTPIIEMNCLEYMRNYDKYNETALLLSWLDYETLGIRVLNMYKGLMVISVGNYYHNSPNYLKKLNDEYSLLRVIYLKMPWGLEEKIEIYKKNIKVFKT